MTPGGRDRTEGWLIAAIIVLIVVQVVIVAGVVLTGTAAMIRPGTG